VQPIVTKYLLEGSSPTIVRYSPESLIRAINVQGQAINHELVNGIEDMRKDIDVGEDMLA
jgi:hypothetical protein